MKRREFCRTAMAGTGALAAVPGARARSATDAADAMGADGTVTTRDHFTIGPWNFVYLDGGVGEYEYEIEDPVPGLDGPSPDEIAVFVHGWLIDDGQADDNFEIVRNTLRANGYTHPLVGFEWDADDVAWFDDWYPSVQIARRNGKKLGRFVADYREQNPDTAVRLIGHSLGARVVLATVAKLDAGEFHESDAPWDDRIDAVTLLGGAVDDEAPTESGEYAGAIRRRAVEVDNFHTPYDEKLRTGYTSVEFDDPLGVAGSDGQTPTNYEDHRVPSVDGHLQYYRQSVGCMPTVIEEWRTDDGDERRGDGGDGQEPAATWRRSGSIGDDEEGDDYTRELELSAPSTVVVSLTGGEYTDFDLYVTLDGRTPTTDDYDDRSWGYDSSERIELDGWEVGDELGVLVHAYADSGEYTVTVEEYE